MGDGKSSYLHEILFDLSPRQLDINATGLSICGITVILCF